MLYSTCTSAPMASMAFLSFSTSSLVAFSLSVLGSVSTNFLACAHTIIIIISKGVFQGRKVVKDATHLDQVHRRHQSLDFLDGFGFSSSVDLGEVDVEEGLFLGLLFFGSSVFLGGSTSSSATSRSSSSSRSSIRDVCNVQAGLYNPRSAIGSASYENMSERRAHLERLDKLGGFKQRQSLDLVHNAIDLGRGSSSSRRRARRGGFRPSRFGNRESCRAGVQHQRCCRSPGKDGGGTAACSLGKRTGGHPGSNRGGVVVVKQPRASGFEQGHSGYSEFPG